MTTVYYEAEKDPDSVLSYVINWASEDGTNDGTAADTGWLQGDTIDTSTWDVPAGLTVVSTAKTGTTTKIVLAGGTADSIYICTNHILTVTGNLEEDRAIIIRVLPAVDEAVISTSGYCSVVEADATLALSTIWAVASAAQKASCLNWARIYLDDIYDTSAVDEDDAPDALKEANAMLAEEHIGSSIFKRQSAESLLVSKTVTAGSVSTSKTYSAGMQSKWSDPFPQITALLRDVCALRNRSVQFLMRA